MARAAAAAAGMVGNEWGKDSNATTMLATAQPTMVEAPA
jgi:hypothetical protein